MGCIVLFRFNLSVYLSNGDICLCLKLRFVLLQLNLCGYLLPFDFNVVL